MCVRTAAICALVLSAISERPVLEARFIGNMAFAITDGSVTLMTDFPYESGYSRYMTYPPEEIRSTTPTTLSLITHRHGDHWKPSLFAQTDWQVAGPNDVIASAPAHRVVPLTEPRTVFGPIEIEPIATPHADVGHYSYIVTWHGKRLYFSGDTESSASLRAAKNLDVAFISPWIYRAVVRNNHFVDARRIVIYHHESGERIPECREPCVVPRQADSIPIW
jgi:L-ascorbate metabolism protein UlaG (beta-lactamase superfamily)